MTAIRNLALMALVACSLSLAGAALPRWAPASPPAAPSTSSEAKAAVMARMAKLPLRFEANAGQWDERVAFVARQGGATLFITEEGMTFSLLDVKAGPRTPGMSRQHEIAARNKALAEAKTATVTMKLVVGAPAGAPSAKRAVLRGEKELITKSNFFLGNDKTKWRTNVPNYAQVRAKDAAAGVDVVWHGGDSGLEYDLDVAAGVDARKLVFEIEGADRVGVAEDGSLEIATAAGTLVQRPPKVVQDGRELRTRYEVRAAQGATKRVGFAIDGYDETLALLIDPVLTYSTYLGGSGEDEGRGIAVDGAGCAYVTGSTYSTNFPTANAYQGAHGGGIYDAFVTKFADTQEPTDGGVDPDGGNPATDAGNAGSGAAAAATSPAPGRAAPASPSRPSRCFSPAKAAERRRERIAPERPSLAVRKIRWVDPCTPGKGSRHVGRGRAAPSGVFLRPARRSSQAPFPRRPAGKDSSNGHPLRGSDAAGEVRAEPRRATAPAGNPAVFARSRDSLGI